MKKHLLMIAVLGLVLFGCGDDVTKTTVVEGAGILQLALGEEFPECSEENGGETLYAADSGKAYICTGKAWTPLHGESSADTVVVRDTLVQKDSVFLSRIDTVVVSKLDTLVIRDSLFGLNGESCTVEILEDGSGYKILCGGDSVGVVLNGEMGDDGESCTVADSGNGVVLVQCEIDTVALYKAVCGTTPYDPDSGLFCQNGAFYFTDSRDGQVYRTITIGTQTWMAENLNYRYMQGTAELDSSSFCYDGDASNCETYGRLYLWSAAIDSAALANDVENPIVCGYGEKWACGLPDTVRGVCPAGWHLPTEVEWEALFTAVGGQFSAGTKLKTTSGWDNDGNGTDYYGFSALPAGYSNKGSAFYDVGSEAYFWSATSEKDVVNSARHMWLYSAFDSAGLGKFVKNSAVSVRCIKD